MTRVGVVTGAAGAMGAACAGALAADLDVLVLTDLDGAKLDRVASAIRRPEVCTVVGDLADASLVAKLVAQTGEMGELGALVNTAGISPSMADWRSILRVDLVAATSLLDAFLPLVVPGSAAVCVASISGHMGPADAALDAVLRDPSAPDFEARFASLFANEPDPGWTYRCAKLGVIQLAARAAIAWGARGGRVVSVSPGLIDTAMGRLELEHNEIKSWMAQTTPLSSQRLDDDTPLPGRVNDIADAIAFLCSDRASFVSGCDLLVDGGLLAAMNAPASGGNGGS